MAIRGKREPSLVRGAVAGLYLGCALCGSFAARAQPEDRAAAPPSADAPPGGEAVRAAPDNVVVLHGLGRSAWSMWLLASRVEEAGFAVHNLDYPSTEASVEELVAQLQIQVKECCLGSDRPLHFVTHSLGGILVRAYVAKDRPKELGRVVMLSPPNKGSELSDGFRDNSLFEWAMGPAGRQLGTGNGSVPNTLGPADFELGIITGDVSFNPLASWLVVGSDDGKVSVESARLDGMKDFLVVPHSHTYIMNSSEVGEQVIYFLRNGRFEEVVGEK